MRNHNTSCNGTSWPEEIKLLIWKKGKVISNFAPEEWRRDLCGFAIRYCDFGNRASYYGWEIDHILPVSQGGNDTLANLQPLHWKNNAEKGDSLTWKGKR